MLQEQHSFLVHFSNIESTNKKPSSCVFHDIILVSNYLSYKEKTVQLLPYHSFYGGHIQQEKLSLLFWQSISKKCKVIRMSIQQHYPKKFQTSSAMMFAALHIKHVYRLLLLCKIYIGSVKRCAVYIKGKNVYCPSLIPSQYNAFLYFLEGQVRKNSKLGIISHKSCG